MVWVNWYADCATPLHVSSFGYAPGHCRSRLSDQKLSRAIWCCCAYAVMVFMSLTVTVACSSVIPFIDEMPTCLYASASDHPYAVLSLFFSPSAAWMVNWPWLPPVLPQSKVMMPQPSTTRPAPAARLISELSGPPVPLPRVM